MSWQKPSPRVLWNAIQVYLSIAYNGPAQEPGGLPAGTPSAVRARLDTLRSTPDDAFYDSPVFERIAPKDAKDAKAPPTKYALRLGNRHYPHMKVVIDRAPDGHSYLLRADTHDTHVQPRPGSREAAAFMELVRANQAVAEAVEAAWETQGLPTFKKYLRDDLERRKAAMGSAPPDAPVGGGQGTG